MATLQETYEKSSPLKQLQLMLEYTGTSSYCPPATEVLPFEQLLIPLAGTTVTDLSEDAPDSGAEPLFIQLAFADEILKGLARVAPSSQPPPVLDKVLLQFSIHFPLVAEPSALPLLSQLLGLLTQLSPFGAYGLMEQDKVFYRYTVVCENKEIVTPLNAWLLENMIYFNEAFWPILQQAATGQSDLDSLGQAALLALAA